MSAPEVDALPEGIERRSSMAPPVRRFVLTAHVACSVGWLGAVAGFLVLSIAGLTSHSAEIVRAAYLAMNLIGQFLIVPLSLAALVSGLVQSLGTHWGVFRYYWVTAKFALTVGATLLLVLHQFTAVAGAAGLVSGVSANSVRDAELRRVGIQLVADASLAIGVLLTATALSVYKPWGRMSSATSARAATRRRMVLLAIAGIVAVLIIRHLTVGGVRHHGF
jgi:hypothetical protein